MPRLPFLAAVLGCALVAAASYSPRADFAAAEQAWIRAHLDSVERELRAKDVSLLAPGQREARLRNLDVLHGYWVRGVFPQNTDFPGQRVPYFIDRYGTRCAMAYLIEQSGEGDLVTRVAATHNNARIPELRTDPDLGAWLWRNGITLEEAARIQPAYGCCPVGAFCIDVIPQPCPSTSASFPGTEVACCRGAMIRPERLTVKAAEALQQAGTLARTRGNPVVNDAHLFHALLSQDDGIVVPLLQKAGLNVTQLKADTERELGRFPTQSGATADPTLSREVSRVLDRAE